MIGAALSTAAAAAAAAAGVVEERANADEDVDAFLCGGIVLTGAVSPARGQPGGARGRAGDQMLRSPCKPAVRAGGRGGGTALALAPTASTELRAGRVRTCSVQRADHQRTRAHCMLRRYIEKAGRTDGLTDH